MKWALSFCEGKDETPKGQCKSSVSAGQNEKKSKAAKKASRTAAKSEVGRFLQGNREKAPVMVYGFWRSNLTGCSQGVRIFAPRPMSGLGTGLDRASHDPKYNEREPACHSDSRQRARATSYKGIDENLEGDGKIHQELPKS
jgi:hypothetical protein